MIETFTKAQVAYTDVAMDLAERCEVCKYYLGLTHCQVLPGARVNKLGWCNKFEKLAGPPR